MIIQGTGSQRAWPLNFMSGTLTAQAAHAGCIPLLILRSYFYGIFFELFLGGLTRGSIYALIALGYTMVYGIVS
jgi:hypothetical protein